MSAPTFTTQDVHDALQSIPPGIPRDDWVKVGMALHSAGFEEQVFKDWSSSADNFEDANCTSTWRNFKKKDGGIGIGTLFAMAMEHGWKKTAPFRRTLVAVGTDKVSAEPKSLAALDPENKDPVSIFSRGVPATASHWYVMEKGAGGVNLDQVRVLPSGDSLMLCGESMAGALMVPFMRPDGTICSIQFIVTQEVAQQLQSKGRPGKLNLPGSTQDGFFTVGDLRPDDVIYVVEGVGQAWSCWQATGKPAVSTFGAGRMNKIAALLRETNPTSQLVLVGDTGKEGLVEEIAKEVGGRFVTMPPGWQKNDDVNDLARREGLDVLESLLWSAKEPEIERHPLAIFEDFDSVPEPPRWVIPGFIEEGIVMIGGAHGIGKSTVLLPLALVAAGLHVAGDPLAPRHWRHVVYVVEDVQQARRILAGLIQAGGLGIKQVDVKARLHLVAAKRLDPEYVFQVGRTYRKEFARVVDGVELLPLVVFDTNAAVIDIEDENNNSLVSKVLALAKQSFCGLPLWIVGHISKQNFSRRDANSISVRGGSAYEADANQVLYLLKDVDESRYLARGKTRFEARWSELKVVSTYCDVLSKDRFGNPEMVGLRWSLCEPPTMSRANEQVIAIESARKAVLHAIREEILQLVATGWITGNPLNRSAVRERVKHRSSEVVSVIELLLSEGWLHEITVPSKMRTNPKRSSFLVCLTRPELNVFIKSGELPQEKMVIPATWCKSENSSMAQRRAE